MSSQRDFDVDWQRFPALMAHDLKGPIGNMTLYTQMAMEEIDIVEKSDPDTAMMLRKLVGQVHDSCEKLLFQVQCWVDAHLLIRGLYQKKEELTDVQQLLEQALESVKPEFSSRGLKLTLSPSAPAKIFTDPLLVKNSLKNLLYTIALFVASGEMVKITGHVHQGEAIFDIDYPASPGMERVRSRLMQDFSQNRNVDTTEGILKTGVFGMVFTNLAVKALAGTIHIRDIGHRSAFGVTIPCEH
jgi:signal transduction histidine kinase